MSMTINEARTDIEKRGGRWERPYYRKLRQCIFCPVEDALGPCWTLNALRIGSDRRKTPRVPCCPECARKIDPELVRYADRAEELRNQRWQS